MAVPHQFQDSLQFYCWAKEENDTAAFFSGKTVYMASGKLPASCVSIPLELLLGYKPIPNLRDYFYVDNNLEPLLCCIFACYLIFLTSQWPGKTRTTTVILLMKIKLVLETIFNVVK
jgi:hypothetical protein